MYGRQNNKKIAASRREIKGTLFYIATHFFEMFQAVRIVLPRTPVEKVVASISCVMLS